MRILNLICLLFVVSSCVSYGPTLQQKIDYYKGWSESQIITSLGIPTRTYESSGITYLEYTRSKSGSSERTVPSLHCSATFCPGPRTVTSNYTNWCTITFILNDKKIIINGTYRGNNC